ncbi:MAG: HEAT repeat domain-containing protein [Proteobacteria bacterium]|nr:HEAT repeat domain-containing protein [Pseudomonadota bacterium]
MKAGIGLACAATLALGVLACDESPRAESPAPTQTPTPTRAALPAPGKFEISYTSGSGLVSLRANDAPLGRILRWIGGVGRFELELPDDDALPTVALEIGEMALPGALPLLLAGFDYEVEMAPHHRTGQSVVRRLSVRPAGTGAPDPPGEVAAPAESPRARPPDPVVEAHRRERGERRERREAEQARWIAMLQSSDPAVRSDAAEELDPRGPGLEKLVELVRDDPDPEVRAVAVSRLEDADAHTAVAALVAALDDSDAQVVLAAIDALEFSGDETILPWLEALADHPDGAVQEAAADAIDFLQ